MADIVITLTFPLPYPLNVEMLTLNRLDDGHEITLSDDPLLVNAGGGIFTYTFSPPVIGLKYVYTYKANMSGGGSYKGRGYKQDAQVPAAPANVVLNISTDPPPAVSGVLLTLKRLDNGASITIDDGTLTGPDGDGVFHYSFPPPAANLKYSYTYLLTFDDDTTYAGTGFKQDAQVPAVRPAALDAALLAVVKAILNAIGGTATLQFIPNYYEPLTGLTTQEAQQWPVKCSPPYQYKKAMINGTTVKAGDFMMILPAKPLNDFGVVPDTQMSIVRSNRKFTIVSVEPIDSGNAVVAYIIQCRNA